MHIHTLGTSALQVSSIGMGYMSPGDGKRIMHHDEPAVKSAMDAVRSLSGKKRSPAQTALQFVLKNPAVTCIVVGLRTLDQLEVVAIAAEAPGLSEEEMNVLRSAAPGGVF